MTTYRSDIELPEVDASTADFESLSIALNRTINFLNFFTKSISLQSNFNCNVSSISIPATSSVKVQHFLGVVPKYRIILRQEGNGVVSDIPSEWNTKYISLYNNGAEEVKITVIILRE